jgi:hypothetical protein
MCGIVLEFSLLWHVFSGKRYKFSEGYKDLSFRACPENGGKTLSEALLILFSREVKCTLV